MEWLQKHNPGYSHIQINNKALNDYPDCDVLPYHIEHVPNSSQGALDALTRDMTILYMPTHTTHHLLEIKTKDKICSLIMAQ